MNVTRIDVQREGTPDVGRVHVYGWCAASPTNSCIGIQPSTKDLSHYITASGPTRTREACDSQRNGR